MEGYAELRRDMVEQQIAARGVRSSLVLDAIGRVAREAFVPKELEEFAYQDSPLPIGEEQTISQPFVVAYMIEALELEGGETVLEVGTGSGYAAAVLAEIAGTLYAIERHSRLAEAAEQTLARLGYRNIHVRHGDGSQGWPEAAPFDAIVVAAGGPEVPISLREQLREGGRLVIPVGRLQREQRLTRITRTGKDSFEEEDLGSVRFVPLIGAEAWEDVAAPRRPLALSDLVAASAEPFATLESADLAPLLDRIGEAQLVLIGEATHGTSEFYRMRQQITRTLIQQKGFRIVAAEADWPDAQRIDHYVRHRGVPTGEWLSFARFPTWMWRNHEVRGFVDWLHERNAAIPRLQDRAALYGLDLYSLSTSITAVLAYLDDVDPDAAALARERYGCLTPWQADPATYGRIALSSGYKACVEEVTRMLRDLLDKRMAYLEQDGERLFDAIQNARLVADAEHYYRTMYLESHRSWNLRDSHMFDTLQALVTSDLAPGDKAVVWAHNSHIGDARATEMRARGEHNIGQLCREAYGRKAYLIGFGTDSGTVAAASDWDGPVEIKTVRPSHRDSYERVCHDSQIPGFLLPLQRPRRPELRQRMMAARLERAIGVIYRPETELASHYFDAILPEQFDEYIWFDRSEAVRPLKPADIGEVLETYPFGL